MAENIKADLCVAVIANTYKAFPSIRGAIVHSDRGSQYISTLYREELKCCEIVQSMNGDGGRCHDNARCEAVWAGIQGRTPIWQKSYKEDEHRGADNSHIEVLHDLLEYQKNMVSQWWPSSNAQGKTVL